MGIGSGSSKDRGGWSVRMIQVEAGLSIGKYRVTEYLGRGGFSLVYLAEHRETGERVALKIGDSSGGGRFVDRSEDVDAKPTPATVAPDESPADAVFFDGNAA